MKPRANQGALRAPPRPRPASAGAWFWEASLERLPGVGGRENWRKGVRLVRRLPLP